MLMLIILVILAVMRMVKFNTVRFYRQNSYEQQTMFSSNIEDVLYDKKTELENRILMLSKLKMDGVRDELVRLMVELYEYGDTSMFLDQNPCVHETIFSMSD